MPSSHNNFQCECGNSYSTEKGLQQHKRRYCRGQPVQGQNFNCTQCNRQFASYAGMRQHLRLAHPESYNADLQAESENARQFWTNDEESELAKHEAELEANLPLATILNHLQQYSSRSREALKLRRRKASYIEKVNHFRELNAIITNNQSVEQDLTTEVSLQKNLILQDFIANLNEDHLTESDTELRNTLLQLTSDGAKEALENWCESMLAQIVRPNNHRVSNRAKAREELIAAINQPGLSRRRKRAKEYKLAQMDYKADQKAYANSLLDGVIIETSAAMPSEQDINTHYKDIFESTSPEDNEIIVDKCTETTVVSHPITMDEVERAIKTMKSNCPGPDGITLKKVLTIPRIRLVLLFNAILLLESVPTIFKKSKTTLIPKNVENRSEIKNWRPITIGSILIRIFNKILANRIVCGINLHGSQRGFTKIDGCFANTIIVENIIKTRRKRGSPLALITLDLAKAFDKVSHHSISRALRRFNIDQKTANIIMSNYEECATDLFCNNIFIGSYKINRGVKQGDPLSPILFNMILDELLVKLEEKHGVPVGDNTKVCSLAYADDLVLCAETCNDANSMLNLTIQFLERRGLQLNVNKCSSLVLKTVPSKKKVFVATSTQFNVNDEPIPILNIGQELRYLGQKFSTEGLIKCNMEKLNEQLTSIKRAPLKPQQKFNIIKTYLIPRYIASLQKPNVSAKLLKNVDKKFRTAIKAILHLHRHCHNSIFYTPVKEGGLGIFNFSKMIPVITIKRLNRLRELSELLADIIALSEQNMERLQTQVGALRSTKEVRQLFSNELHSSFSGSGLQQAKHHKACNNFITRPPIYWNGEEFIKALHLRYNLLPCKGMPSIPMNERRCRAGCNKTETVSHILQHCPTTHHQRILRHNYVVKRLVSAARRHGWEVHEEPHIRCDDGVLKKPDAVLIKNDIVIVTDIGINWEGEITLEAQYANKQAIYSSESFIDKIKDLYPNKNIFILPFILGARGTWCRQNGTLVNHLNLSMSDLNNIINTVLRGGWMTHRHFMRVIWRERYTGRSR